jgi:glycerol-3-phosphate dehydrogenase
MFRRLPTLSRRNVALTSSALLATTASYYYLNSTAVLADDSQIPVVKRRPGPLWSPPTREQMMKHLKSSGKTLNAAPATGDKKSNANEPPAGAKANPAALTADSPEDEDIFDLIVVGGGATGSGVALDAASRGLKVACVEREDFSSGTSSKSTKLVHGGVRYLQKAVFELDYEQWKLVKEALRERKIFLETAPHLSHSLP